MVMTESFLSYIRIFPNSNPGSLKKLRAKLSEHVKFLLDHSLCVWNGANAVKGNEYTLEHTKLDGKKEWKEK